MLHTKWYYIVKFCNAIYCRYVVCTYICTYIHSVNVCFYIDYISFSVSKVNFQKWLYLCTSRVFVDGWREFCWKMRCCIKIFKNFIFVFRSVVNLSQQLYAELLRSVTFFVIPNKTSDKEIYLVIYTQEYIIGCIIIVMQYFKYV